MPSPRWRRYLRFWKRDLREDVDDELRFHFEQRVAQFLAHGLNPGDARAAAEAQFGDVKAVRSELIAIDSRVARRHDAILWLDALRADMRATVRGLARTPAFTSAVVVTLALGLGVNAAMFSLLDRVYLRMPGGVTDPRALRRFWTPIVEQKSGKSGATPMSISAELYPRLVTAFDSLATTALFARQPSVRLGNDLEEVTATVIRASAAYLPLLGVRAAIGRLFTADEAHLDSPARVAVISDALWRSRFAKDDGIIGKTLYLTGRPFTIVGVMPPAFTGIDLERTDVWIPLAKEPIGFEGRGSTMWRAGSGPTFSVLARVRPGTRDEALEARATTLLRQSALAGPGADSLPRVIAGSVIEARGPDKPEKAIRIATRLGGVAVIVLLIACANVVNLLLSRATARRREIAVRVALGITRTRLVWLLVVPSVLLALVSGGAAVASAQLTGAVLRAQLLPDIHFAGAPLHWRVAAFTMLVALGAGALAGIIPALQASRPDVTTFLKLGAGDGVVRRSRLRGFLIIVQAALSVLLLVVSGLFLRSLRNVTDIRLGYDVSRLMFASVRYDTYRPPDSVRFASAAERVRRIPGVEQVGMATMAPMGGGLMYAPFYTDTDSSTGNDREGAPSHLNVSSNYFAITGTRIVGGKGFPNDGSLSVMVNETMARRYWPVGRAVGQCMRLPKRESPCYRVVGVVEDAHRRGVIEEPFAHYYLPLEGQPYKGMGGYLLVIRIDPKRTGSVGPAIRRAVVAEYPGGRVRLDLMSDMLAPAYRPFRMGAALFSAFGILALIVATIGVFSTVSYSVSQRTHEFGVRIALGATMRDVIRAVVQPALAPVTAGVAIGIAAAVAGGRLVASLLYGVSPTNPGVMIGVAAILLVTGIIASIIPAIRAARVDPVVALRVE